MKKCQVKECPHWEQNRGQPCLCLSGKPKLRTTEAGGWNTWVRMAARHTESGTCREVSVTLKVSPQLMTRRSWEDSGAAAFCGHCNDYLKVGSLNCCKLRLTQHQSCDRLQIIPEMRTKARLEQGCSPQRQLSLAFPGVGGPHHCNLRSCGQSLLSLTRCYGWSEVHVTEAWSPVRPCESDGAFKMWGLVGSHQGRHVQEKKKAGGFWSRLSRQTSIARA